MIRSTILFTLTFFLVACSDTTVDSSSTTSSSPQQENSTQQADIPSKQTKVINTSAKEEAETSTVAKKELPINGHNIYIRKCASCHGQSGEKIALSKSQVITGWKKERSVSALKGYQDGSYGSSMKAIMKGQVSALNDEQIEAVSEYIATL